MSGHYVYKPEVAYQPGPYGFTSPAPFSPYIPDISHLANSPYSRPGSLHNSPNLPTTGLPNVGGVPFPGYSEDNPFFRQRRPSWHGPAPVLDSNLLFAPNAGHNRSNSFGNSAGRPFFPPNSAPLYDVNWSSTVSPWSQPLPQSPGLHINPWLNGEQPRKDLLFNLASPTFNPMRLVGPNGQTVPLGLEDLSSPATYPHIHELRIVHQKIPQWTVELSLQQAPNPYYSPGSAPPITVGDILFQLHQSYHQMVTQAEWSELNTREEQEVANAYRKRCRMMGPGSQAYWESQGVKRVDYLREKTWFRGLIRTGQSLGELRLITGAA